MDTFAPEFSKFWLAEAATAHGDARFAKQGDDGAEQAALEELAERVTAARSVV